MKIKKNSNVILAVMIYFVTQRPQSLEMYVYIS